MSRRVDYFFTFLKKYYIGLVGDLNRLNNIKSKGSECPGSDTPLLSTWLIVVEINIPFGYICS